MSENLFGLTVAADKGLDDLQCQRLLSENRRYQEVMLQYRCALKALESRLEILNEEFSLQHDRNPIESMKSRLKSPSSIMNKMHTGQCKNQHRCVAGNNILTTFAISSQYISKISAVRTSFCNFLFHPLCCSLSNSSDFFLITDYYIIHSL